MLWETKKFTLWQQIAGLSLCSVILVSFTAGRVIRSLEKEYLTNQLAVHTKQLLSVVSGATVDAMITEDVDILETVVEHVSRNSETMIDVIVENSEGQILVQWTREHSSQANVISFSERIVFEEEFFGRMVMKWDLTTPFQLIEHHVQKIRIFLSISLLVLTVIIVSVIYGMTVYPIRKIVQSLTGIGKGRFTESIELHSSKEMEQLAQSVNLMSGILRREKQQEEDHKQQLQQLNQALERKVEQRTHELQEKNLQLAKLNASKDKFFSIVVKDLEMPILKLLDLTSIIPGNIEFFSQDELKETAQTLCTSLQNLHELLKNLFTWSGIQRGSASYHPQAVQLHEVVERNTSFFIPVAEEKQIRLVTDVPTDIAVYADPDMLYAILRNLLSNAMKFSFPGDTVTLSTTQVNDEIDIVIVDTGVGINEEDFAKLFREDVTVQRPGTDGEEGAGLGVILCKQLVEQHGGRISIESTLDEGTTVKVTLPRHTAERQQ
ncbi:MAG: HAMP domain-containing protein [bacterium]|nr:HAMP domain-containing protein [bacterium]